MNSAIIPHVIEQHAEEAAFLWVLRDAAVRAPHYDLKDLAKLDERVEAHIDGLRLAGDAGWELCEHALQFDEAGEVFAAAVLAFESGDGKRVDKVTTGNLTDEIFRGLVSALGWIPYSEIKALLKQLLTANSPVYRRLGLSGYAIHRKDPGDGLVARLNDTDVKVQARALRAVGEFGRRELVRQSLEHLEADDESVRFWAAWSIVRVGDRRALAQLASFINLRSAFNERAMQLALRVMDSSDALSFLKNMARDAERHRYVLLGTGVLGDPRFVPSLIKKMQIPELARVAGEAFSMITGVDIAYEDLEGEVPEGFEAGPTEEAEDEDVDMDTDEDLPWPDAKLIHSWWAKNNNQFKPGTRYLCGQPVTVEHCQQIVKTGYQRQRIAAALELALMQPDEPLLNTSAPGFRQQQWVGIKR